MHRSSSRTHELGTQTSPQTFWEQANCSRWGEYLHSIERKAILMAHNQFDKTGHAVEYGCGGGVWACMLDELGWNMTCIDIDEKSISVCKDRVQNSTCILTDENSTTIPCETNSADLLLLIEVPVMQCDWFLREASRVLVNGGRLVIVVWNRMSWRGFLHHHLARMRNKFDWYSKSYTEWLHQCRETGFVSEYRYGFCWFPFGRFSDSKFIPLCKKFESLMGLNDFILCSPWIVNVVRKI